METARSKDGSFIFRSSKKEEAPMQFSDIEKDGRVDFADVYVDARSFLAKANTTKFVITAFILVLAPMLLVQGHLSEDVFRELMLITALAYLGVDAYESVKGVPYHAKDNHSE